MNKSRGIVFFVPKLVIIDFIDIFTDGTFFLFSNFKHGEILRSAKLVFDAVLNEFQASFSFYFISSSVRRIISGASFLRFAFTMIL